MALTLSLRVGAAFYVDDERVVLRQIVSPDHFIIDAGGTDYDVVPDEACEPFPDVFISGSYRHDYGQARLAIDAPRSIVILREEMYLRDRDG